MIRRLVFFLLDVLMLWALCWALDYPMDFKLIVIIAFVMMQVAINARFERG